MPPWLVACFLTHMESSNCSIPTNTDLIIIGIAYYMNNQVPRKDQIRHWSFLFAPNFPIPLFDCITHGILLIFSIIMFNMVKSLEKVRGSGNSIRNKLKLFCLRDGFSRFIFQGKKKKSIYFHPYMTATSWGSSRSKILPNQINYFCIICPTLLFFWNTFIFPRYKCVNFLKLLWSNLEDISYDGNIFGRVREGHIDLLKLT